jgi:hypothetical protein
MTKDKSILVRLPIFKTGKLFLMPRSRGACHRTQNAFGEPMIQRRPAMTKKPTTSAKGRDKVKHFNLSESNDHGLDNGFSVSKKRKGYYLYSTEEGEPGGPCDTISEALNWGGITYMGEYVEIDTQTSNWKNYLRL